jgi:hypothetical protein
MKRYDAKESTGIVSRMMVNLAATIPQQGRAGSDARSAINDVRVNAFFMLMGDTIGPPLAAAFDSATEAGCTLLSMESVRQQIALENPRTQGGLLVRDTGINFCLAQEGKMIEAMTFVSRQDVDQLRKAMVQPFADAEEIAADAMDSMTYQALVRLHAAINNHLVKTALPLPRMVNYVFFEPLPSLVLAHRLYNDAGRADEIRNENKIVHPAFCPPNGQALSN